MNDERVINAVHEAGHAVANIALGLPFTLVRIEPDARLVWGEHARYTPSTGRYLAMAVSHLAGAAAVQLLTGERDDGGASADYCHAREKLGEVPDAPSVEDVYATAFGLLYTARAAVTAVANELLACAELPYSRVMDLTMHRGPGDAVLSTNSLPSRHAEYARGKRGPFA